MDPDHIPMQEFYDCEFIDIEEGALAYLEDPKSGWVDISNCGDFSCTGPWNTFLYLEDATFSGDVTPDITLSG